MHVHTVGDKKISVLCGMFLHHATETEEKCYENEKYLAVHNPRLVVCSLCCVCKISTCTEEMKYCI